MLPKESTHPVTFIDAPTKCTAERNVRDLSGHRECRLFARPGRLGTSRLEGSRSFQLRSSRDFRRDFGDKSARAERNRGVAKSTKVRTFGAMSRLSGYSSGTVRNTSRRDSPWRRLRPRLNRSEGGSKCWRARCMRWVTGALDSQRTPPSAGCIVSIVQQQRACVGPVCVTKESSA